MDNGKDERIKEVVGRLLESYHEHSIVSNLDSDNMPNKDMIIAILELVKQVLFPGFFGRQNLKSELVEYHVGETLEIIHYQLEKQVIKALYYNIKTDLDGAGYAEMEKKAESIVTAFIQRLPEIREVLETDVQAAFEGDPAACTTDEVIFCYPGFFAITINRIAHELYLEGVPLIPRIMTEYAHSVTGIDIHPGATIGRYFFIDHGTGVVIGETTVIGDNVKIYQGVTLGALSTKGGQQLNGVKRHPTIEDNVTIYSGASILGGQTVIGNGVTVGSNAFVTTSIAENTRVSIKNPELRLKNNAVKEMPPAEF